MRGRPQRLCSSTPPLPCPFSDKKYWYRAHNIREGQTLVGGSIIGEVYENELMKDHKIMVPPNVFGEVVKVDRLYWEPLHR